MNRIKPFTIVLSIIFLISIIAVSPRTTESFIGKSDKVTSVFTISQYARIDWTYNNSTDYSYFEAFMYEEGDTYYPDYKMNFGDNNTGTTYYYLSGNYYFNVTAINIANWEIKVTETSGEYMSNQDTINGIYSKNSKIFNSFGNTEITWSTVKANDNDIFFVYIYSPGSSTIVSSFHGTSGTKFLYQKGEFYLNILTANLLNYTINLNAKTSETTSLIPDSTSKTKTTNGFDIVEFSLIVPVAILLVIRNKKSKRL